MATKAKIRNHANIVKHHPEDPYSQSKTEKQWRAEGRIVTGTGEVMYVNSNWSKATYYAPGETREATPEEQAAYKESLKAKKRDTTRESRRKKKDSEVEHYPQSYYIMRSKQSKNYAEIFRLKQIRDKLPAESVLCLDTETTGFGIDDELLQIGIMNGRGEVVFNEYIKPQNMTSWPEAEAVNGISPAMVADKPTIGDYTDKLNALFSGAKLIMGYNLGFDLGFIRRAGIVVPNEAIETDVMELAAPILGDYYNNKFHWLKLHVCASNLGYTGEGYHDALADTRATLFCFDRLLDFMRDPGEMTIEEMDKLLTSEENELYPPMYIDSIMQDLLYRRRKNNDIPAEKLLIRTIKKWIPYADLGTIREDGTLEPIVAKDLTPGIGGTECKGAGEWPFECQCDNCDFFLLCHPDTII